MSGWIPPLLTLTPIPAAPVVTGLGTTGPSMSDTFTRTQSELGTSDSGDPWSDQFAFAGTGFTFATDGTRATATPTVSNSSQSRGLPDIASDGDWYMDVQFQSAAAGGLQEQGIIAVYDGTTYLRLMLRQAATGVVTLRIESSRSAGTLLGSATLASADPVANSYTLHLQKRGLVVNANAYLAGSAEPSGWMASGLADAVLDPVAGKSGWRVNVGSGNTNIGAFYMDNAVFTLGGVTSSVANLALTRAVSDTGSTITSTIQEATTHLVTNSDVSIGSSVRPAIAPVISSTGATIGSSVIPTIAPQVTSTGSSITSSITVVIVHGVTSSDVAITSSVSAGPGRPITSAGMQRGPADTFTRTVSANGWGAEELYGLTWTSASGAAAYSVNGSAGQMGPLAVQNRRLYVTPLGLSDAEVQCDISADQAASAGGSITMLLGLRLQPNHQDGYFIKLGYETSGAVTLAMQLINTSTTSLAGLPTILASGGQVAGTVWRMRLRAVGTTFQGKLWRPGVDPEPVWRFNVTDSTFASGDASITGNQNAGATATPTISFDNYHVDLDFLVSAPTRAIGDTGSTIGSSVAITAGRQVTNSDVSISDSVGFTFTPGSTSYSRPVSDTGATITSSVQVLVGRPVADTGATITSSVQALIARLVADTGATITSSVAITAIPTLTSTGATITSSAGTARAPAVASTGATIGSSVAITAAPTITSTGSTISSSAAAATTRLVSSTDVSIGSSVIVRAGPAVTSTGATIASSVTVTAARQVSSADVSIGSSVTLMAAPAGITSTGTTITSAVAITAIRLVTNTDLAISSSVAASTGGAANVTDTGSTITSTVAISVARPISSTGSTITSTAAITITPVASSTGATITSSVGPQQITRAVADTGSTIASSVAITAAPLISSVGAAITSSAALIVPRTVSSTGTTIGSSITPTIIPALTSTGSTITSSIAILVGRAVSSTGATITSSAAITAAPTGITSTGSTITSSAAITPVRAVSSTGASVTSSVAITAIPLISSTGATISDSASNAHIITTTSTGATITSSVASQATFQRPITSSGATISDTPGRSVVLTIPVTDAGATITSSVSAIPPIFVTDVGVQGAHVIDTFQRSTSSELGTADTGQSWVNNFAFAGTGWTFSVNGATAFAQTNVSNQSQSRGVADLQVDGDWYADVQYSSHAAGGLQEQGIILCHDATSGVYFRAQIREAASGVVSLAIESSRGTGTLIGSRFTLSGADPVTNAYTIHVQKLGRLLRANAYQAGTSEPSGWMTSGQADALLDPIGGGQPGWRVNAGSGNTNFAAFTLDNVNFATNGVGSTVGLATARSITTSGATIGSVAAITPPPGTATDIGAAITSSVAITAQPAITTTGAAVDSTIALVVARQVSSTGATISSGFGKVTIISVVDAGTQADSVVDNFARVVASGLGIADTGQAWSDVLNFAGIGWTFSVSGGTAVAVPTSANQTQTRGQRVAQTDGEWRMDVQFSSHAAGGQQEQGHYISGVDSSTYIRVMLREATTGVVSLRIESSVGSTLLASATMPGADPVAGAYTIHVVRLGNRITANAYPAGSAEPGGWMAAGVARLADPTGGTSGWRVSAGSGNTNLATYRMDNYLDVVPGVNSSIASTRLRGIADSITITSSVSATPTRPGGVSSTGATITSSASVQAVHTRLPASSGASVDSSVGLLRVLGRTALSAGATIDSFVALSSTGARAISSTGATIDSTARGTVTRPITSTGATISSVAAISSTRYVIAITSHAFSGLYPSMTLYPSTTLYPSYSMSDSVTTTVTRSTITTGVTSIVLQTGESGARYRTGSQTATVRHNPAGTTATLRGTGRTSLTYLRGTTTSVSSPPSQTSVRPLVGATEALV